MQHSLRRPIALAAMLGSVVFLTAATQGAKFPGGVFKTSDGTSTVAIEFDSTGKLNVYVNNESFAQSSWQVKADTLTFGAMTGPEGYACSNSGKYLWAFADNRISFTLVGNDDCQSRRDGLVGMVWTRG